MDKLKYPFFASIYNPNETDVTFEAIITNDYDRVTYSNIHAGKTIIVRELKWKDTKSWNIIKRIRYGTPKWITKAAILFAGWLLQFVPDIVKFLFDRFQ